MPVGGLLAADEGVGGVGKETASQAQRQLHRPLTGPSVSFLLSPADPRSPVGRSGQPLQRLWPSQAEGGRLPPREASCSVLPSCKRPPGEKPALVPGPLPTQEADGRGKRRGEAKGSGSMAGGLVAPPAPTQDCLPAV